MFSSFPERQKQKEESPREETQCYVSAKGLIFEKLMQGNEDMNHD